MFGEKGVREMTDGFRNEKVTVDVIERLGVLNTKPNGYTLECNIVSWNGNKPKVDIRSWCGYDRPTRGITLTEEEAKALYEVLKGRYEA